MSLVFNPNANLASLLRHTKNSTLPEGWEASTLNSYRKIVTSVFPSGLPTEYRFASVQRARKYWKVTYHGTGSPVTSRLVLILDAKQPQWLIFVENPDHVTDPLLRARF